jgi:hypothetical protein
MSDHASSPNLSKEEVYRLAMAVIEDDISPAESQRFESLIATDPTARGWYVDLICDVCSLRRLNRSQEVRVSPPHTGEITPANQPINSVPVLNLLGDTTQGSVGYLSSGWLVAYLVATVVLGIGLLVGAVTHVSQPVQVVGRPTHSPVESGIQSKGGQTTGAAQSLVVGRITGMADCCFATDAKTKDPRPKTVVSLGDHFNLLSGLLEITYDTGAKVILQGPVTYKVESSVGGFLSVGKLTARVDNSKTKDQRPKTLIPHPSSLILHPFFVVRTPTALVTDLGTEFGVEVARSGETTSHVFRGSIRVQRTDAAGKVEAEGRVLGENETVLVEGSPGNRQIMTFRTFTPAHFVRTLPRATERAAIKTFDLVDVVAGGDGFSGARSGGIHPLTGDFVKAGRAEDNNLLDNGRYHRVHGSPFVDGVFSPGSGSGPVQVDSAGHLCEDFFTTQSFTGGCILAGGVIPMLPSTAKYPVIPAVLGGVDYSTQGHGWILLHANKGITFDLDAIRKANPEYQIRRFRAVTGNSCPEPWLADVSVLIDGTMRFRRRQINHTLGAMPIKLPIRENDRFLTLVATDGGDGVAADWIIFGDPRLDLLLSDSASTNPPFRPSHSIKEKPP